MLRSTYSYRPPTSYARIAVSLALGLAPVVLFGVSDGELAALLLLVSLPFLFDAVSMFYGVVPSLTVTLDELKLRSALGATLVIRRDEPIIFVVTGTSSKEKIVIRCESEDGASLAKERPTHDRVIPRRLCRRPEKLAQLLNRWVISRDPRIVIREMNEQLA